MAVENRQIWPGWEIGSCIGKGGFGEVYELHRDVFGDVEKKALKVIRIPKDHEEIDYLRIEGLDNKSINQTFYQQVGDIVREYKIMTQAKLLDNPNIVHCDDCVYEQRADGIGWDIYIRMELLTPLLKALDAVKSERQVIQLGLDLCNALAGCQDVNIIHRDIKPQNIFVSPTGRFKLGDFGISRSMERTMRATAGVGTYSYMAPEVINGQPYGPAADIYSLGLVLYWLLNEYRGPFLPLAPAVPSYQDNEDARRRRFGGEQIPFPRHGSPELKAVVMRALEYDPRRRFSSAREMMSALNQIGKSRNPGPRQEPGIPAAQASIPMTTPIPQTPQIPPIPQAPNHAAAEEKKNTAVTAIATLGAVAILAAALFLAPGIRDREDKSETISLETTYAAQTQPPRTEPVETEPPVAATSCAHDYVLGYQAPNVPGIVCRLCGEVDSTAPILLTQLQVLADTNSASSKEDVVLGNFQNYGGEMVENAIKFWVINAAGYTNTESVELYLGGVFSDLQTTIQVAKGSNANTNMVLRFYGDGQLLGEVYNITPNSALTHVVNVQGVKTLRIECSTRIDVFGHCIVAGQLYG